MMARLLRASRQGASRLGSAVTALRCPGSAAAGSARCIVSATEGKVLYEERADGVGVITLNAPDKLNALGAEMGDEFLEVVEHLRTEASTVNAVVLTGAGKAFSAGGDLNFLMQRHNDTPSRNTYIMRKFYQRFLSVRDIPVPVVAAINGPAIGAGAAVALACDIRVAAENAKIGLTFVKLGLHPGMGSTHFLPSVTNPQVAAKMLLTGETITGAAALQHGLVLETAADGAATLERALAIAGEMAAAAPIAVRSCVRSLRLAQDEGLERALWREADSQAPCYASADLGDGVRALMEKRPVEFTGREHYNEAP